MNKLIVWSIDYMENVDETKPISLLGKILGDIRTKFDILNISSYNWLCNQILILVNDAYKRGYTDSRNDMYRINDKMSSDLLDNLSDKLIEIKKLQTSNAEDYAIARSYLKDIIDSANRTKYFD